MASRSLLEHLSILTIELNRVSTSIVPQEYYNSIDGFITFQYLLNVKPLKSPCSIFLYCHYGCDGNQNDPNTVFFGLLWHIYVNILCSVQSVLIKLKVVLQQNIFSYSNLDIKVSAIL